MITKTARLSVAQGPCSAVLPTVHGCHYAFQKFPVFFLCHPVQDALHQTYTTNYGTCFLNRSIRQFTEEQRLVGQHFISDCECKVTEVRDVSQLCYTRPSACYHIESLVVAYVFLCTIYRLTGTSYTVLDFC